MASDYCGHSETQEEKKERLVFLTDHLNKLAQHMVDSKQPEPVSPYRNPRRMLKLDIKQITLLSQDLFGVTINDGSAQLQEQETQPNSSEDDPG